MQSIKGSFEAATPYRQFMLLVFLMLAGVVFMTLAGVGGAALFFGINIMDDPAALDNLEHPTVMQALKFMQVFTSAGMFLLPPLLGAYLVDKDPYGRLGLDRGASLSTMGLGILTMFAALPLVNHLYALNQELSLPAFLSGVEQWMKDSEARAAEITEKFLKADTLGGLGVNLFVIALLPAVGEELLFRGFIQRLFERWFKHVHVAVLLTAILFSSLHMQFLGFLPRVVLGIVLGYMFVWSGSLWLPMIAHFTNNAAAVIMVYLYDKGVMGFDGNELGTGDTGLTYTLVSAALVFAFMWGIQQKSAGNEKSP